MKQKFKNNEQSNKLHFFIGDIRDRERLNLALVNVDIVIHAAALKRVDSIEYNPIEAIKTNIIGTQNLIESSILNKVKYFMSISTDKAVNPFNLYGGTKFCLEKITISSNNFSGNTTKFSVSRYGNVLGSRGSVIEIFDKLKKDNKTITITDGNMTRFTIDMSDAVKFILDNIVTMVGGEIFVPKLPSYNINTLAKYFTNEEPKIIGLRPGEKLHEEMIGKYESFFTKILDDKYVILGDNMLYKENLSVYDKYDDYEKMKSYNSFENEYISQADLFKKIDFLLKK